MLRNEELEDSLRDINSLLPHESKYMQDSNTEDIKTIIAKREYCIAFEAAKFAIIQYFKTSGDTIGEHKIDDLFKTLEYFPAVDDFIYKISITGEMAVTSRNNYNASLIKLVISEQLKIYINSKYS